MSKSRKRMKQKTINMIGCSKSHKHTKSCFNSNKECPNCGPNCHCGSNCNCPHKCPGNCYLNRRGGGCGTTGCPVGGLLAGGNIANGHPYTPWKDPSLQMVQDTGYPFRNNVGGYTYKNKYSKSKYSKSKNHKSKDKSFKKLYKSKTSRIYKYKGGSLIPTDISNLFQGITHNFQSASNALGGYKAPVDPTVYKEQLVLPKRL